MTVSQLIKKLKGVSGSLPVYIADHDHGKYEWNSPANVVEAIDQSKAEEWGIEELQRNPNFIIKGKYLVIRP